MAVQVINQTQSRPVNKSTVFVITEYMGLSTDVKPTDCDKGSIYYQINDGGYLTKYVYAGDNNGWVLGEIEQATIHSAKNDGVFVSVDTTFSNESKGIEVTGNVTQTILPAKINTSYRIKGITILGDGSGGDIKLFGTIGGVITLLLPLYMAASNRGATSSALNLKLDTNTSVYFVTSGRATNASFVGVSYIEF